MRSSGEGKPKSWAAVPGVPWTTDMGITCDEVMSVLTGMANTLCQNPKSLGHEEWSGLFWAPSEAGLRPHHRPPLPCSRQPQPFLSVSSPARPSQDKARLPRACPQPSDSKPHSLHRLFLASLKSAMIKGCREPPYPSILTDATMEKLALAKFVAQESKCEVSGEETPLTHQHWPAVV